MALIIFSVLMAITIVFQSPAKAEDDSIVIKCNNTVDRGKIILYNPPIMNCKDMGTIKMFFGSALTLGPIPNMEALAEQLEAMGKGIRPKPDGKNQFDLRKEKAFEEI